jgi:hypothetical protein
LEEKVPATAGKAWMLPLCALPMTKKVPRVSLSELELEDERRDSTEIPTSQRENAIKCLTPLS